jgi:glycosyltransferase involved in cell wall biosynthesis
VTTPGLRIAFVCHYFSPEPAAPAARVHELARAWVRSGQAVTVLTAFPNFPTGEVPRRYRGRLAATEWVDGIRVLRSWLYAVAHRGVGLRGLNHASFMVTVLLVGFPRLGAVDVVVASSPTLFSALSAWVMARARRVPFVLEVRDLWPDAFAEVGALRNPVALATFRGLASFLYRRAEHVVVVTQAFAERLGRLGVPPTRLTVIPNGADVDLFDPTNADRGAARERLGIAPDAFVVAYVGSHGISHGLDAVLQAARRLPSVTFLLVGDGAERERLVARRDQEDLRNVCMLPSVPKGEVPAIYAAADICLVPLRDVPIFEAFVPSKMFEVMAAARPIVASVRGEARAILERAGAALFAEPEDAAGIADAIATLHADATLRARLGARGRQFVLAHYDRQVLAHRYLGLLERVVRAG